MKNKLLPALAAVLSLSLSTTAVAQASNLPSYAPIETIKDFNRVYVAAEDEEARKGIVKALQKYKGLEVVNSPDDAQFFLDYGVVDKDSHAPSEHMREKKVRSQMRAYTLDMNKRRVIVWSESATRDTEHFLGMKMYDSGRGESEMAGKFIKALKKARGEKK